SDLKTVETNHRARVGTFAAAHNARSGLLQRAGLIHVSVVDRPSGRITPARGGFQAAPVEDRHVATGVADQLALLQRTCCSSDADTTYAQHVRDEFLREIELIRMRAIPRHQKPA